jgi:hypothetical protein
MCRLYFSTVLSTLRAINWRLKCDITCNIEKKCNYGTLKADSHIACRAHAVSMPCRAAKGLECVFPIWFTQCGRVWFTLAMPRLMPCSDHAVLFKATPQHGRRETACGLPARFRLLPATTRSSTKIVIKSIPLPLTTIHTYDCKEW